MSRLDHYLDAAERENTRLSYRSALRHFEIEWGGLLPATTDAVARYLADYGGTLSPSTLRHRLAALSRWHADHGFADPTKAPLVRQVFKGIRAVHRAPEKRAKPLELDVLQQVCNWLERGISQARIANDRTASLRYLRDRALLLLGFWRGFRADELSSLRVEYVDITPDEGLSCYLPRSKGDRKFEGRHFQCPALSRLCPVTAYSAWIAFAALREGPVFRKIERGGRLSESGLHPGSLIPMLRKLFTAAGVAEARQYSSHSLRRGFAGWARSSGWDIKDLMAYVGWRDIKSAMRYVEARDSGLKARFEQGLSALPATVVPEGQPLAKDAVASATIRVTLSLTRYGTGAHNGTRARNRAHRLIEQMCFERYAMHCLDADGTLYELVMPCPSRDSLDDAIYALIDDMYRIADDNRCALETSFHEPATNTHWD